MTNFGTISYSNLSETIDEIEQFVSGLARTGTHWHDRRQQKNVCSYQSTISANKFMSVKKQVL